MDFYRRGLSVTRHVERVYIVCSRLTMKMDLLFFHSWDQLGKPSTYRALPRGRNPSLFSVPQSFSFKPIFSLFQCCRSLAGPQIWGSLWEASMQIWIGPSCLQKEILLFAFMCKRQLVSEELFTTRRAKPGELARSKRGVCWAMCGSTELAEKSQSIFNVRDKACLCWPAMAKMPHKLIFLPLSPVSLIKDRLVSVSLFLLHWWEVFDGEKTKKKKQRL